MLKLFAFSRFRFDSDTKVFALLDLLAASPFPPTAFDEAEPIRRKLDRAKRGEAAGLLSGQPEGGAIFLKSSKPRSTFVFRWARGVVAEWYGEFDDTVVRKGGSKRLVNFMTSLFREFPVVFAGVGPEEDWDAKHWTVEEDDEGGELVTKVGLDLEHCVPGIYWMTAFGPELSAHFGRNTLLAAPAHEAIDLGKSGVVLTLTADPTSGNRAERASLEANVVSALGRQYFFDISQPHRACVGIANVTGGD